MQLRPPQEKALDASVERMVEGVYRQLASLATGIGKTVIFASLRAKHGFTKRIMVLIHTDELAAQAIKKLQVWNPGVKIGLEMGESYALDTDTYVVASVQTLGRDGSPRLNRFKPQDFDALIIDECHHSTADSYQRIISHFGLQKGQDNQGRLLFGVTATTKRGDGRGLDENYDEIIYEYGLLDAIRDGYLCNLRGYRVRTSTNLDTVHSSDGDLNQNELSLAVNTPERNRAVVQAWVDRGEHRQTVAFTVDIQHAKDLAQAFREAGHSFEAVWGVDPDREKKLEDHRDFKLKGICNASLLTEGYDCLDYDTEVLTPSGWKRQGEIQVGDVCYSLNRLTEVIETTPVEAVFDRPVRPGEKMFTINSQHVDIRTTEGHEFHVKCGNTRYKKRPFSTMKGRDLAAYTGLYALPLSGISEEPTGLPLTDDELRFIAWFMTDGGFKGTGVTIAQSKAAKDDIRSLLVRIGLDFTEDVSSNKQGFGGENAKPLHFFRIPKGTHNGSRKRNGWFQYAEYLDKRVAPALHNMTRAQFALFWSECLKGDGSLQGNKAGWLWCCEKAQADAYVQMASIRGFASSYKKVITKKGTEVYRVSVRDTRFIQSLANDKRAAKMTLVRPHANERVWCVSNKNSTLITKRNGKVVIIGNCWSIGCVINAAPTKSQSKYQQRAGRGTRLQDGIANLIEARSAGVSILKEDCILLDVADDTRRHSLASLATLVGVPSKLDFNGLNVLEVIAAIEEAEKASPETDFSQLEDLNEIQSYIERVDLFATKWSPETLEHSELQWHKTPKGNYLLLLPTGEQITLGRDYLNNWQIKGSVKGNAFRDIAHDLAEAFSSAEGLLRTFGKNLLAYLRRDKPAEYGKARATDTQIASINKRLAKMGRPPEDVSAMSSIEAGKYLLSLYTPQKAA
jgi:superfamily II DNA or RNA helicase